MCSKSAPLKTTINQTLHNVYSYCFRPFLLRKIFCLVFFVWFKNVFRIALSFNEPNVWWHDNPLSFPYAQPVYLFSSNHIIVRAEEPASERVSLRRVATAVLSQSASHADVFLKSPVCFRLADDLTVGGRFLRLYSNGSFAVWNTDANDADNLKQSEALLLKSLQNTNEPSRILFGDDCRLMIKLCQLSATDYLWKFE